LPVAIEDSEVYLDASALLPDSLNVWIELSQDTQRNVDAGVAVGPEFEDKEDNDPVTVDFDVDDVEMSTGVCLDGSDKVAKMIPAVTNKHAKTCNLGYFR
jgi:hypothetical protein